MYLLAALSMSIGWGIRGQFGHEYGAAMAGALVGIVVALLGGRQDWTRRVLPFAVFGAIGWSFGGSMSYMKAIAYAHSTDPATLLYGFAAVFLIGFLWAAPGGAGLSLPALLSRDELTAGFVPICAILAAWYLQDVVSDFHEPPGWYDTDYAGATTAFFAASLVAAIRRRVEPITSLAIHMSIGWWIGFGLLVLVAGLRMNPPRGDNWAGMAGLVAGILVWSRRRPGVAIATWTAGFLGGAGFALGHIIKLLVIATGWQTNWHSIMEQTQGLFHGIASAVAMALLLRDAPRWDDAPRIRHWTEVFSVVFLLVLIPYVNLRKSPGDWAQQIDGFHTWMHGIAATGWFVPSRGFIGWLEMLFLAVAAVIVILLARRGPLPLVPNDWTGRAQLLYLSLLWLLVFINAIHVLPRWEATRLVTEWFIAMNAALCTLLVLTLRPASPIATRSLRTILTWGTAAAMLVIVSGYALRRALPHSGHLQREHIRFGPNNTNHIK